MKGAVVGDEILMVAGKAPEGVERRQHTVRGAFDGLGHASRLHHEAKPQEVARIRQRDRIDPVALARLHGDEVFALQPQQRLPHRLAADRIALGELLLAHIIAWRQATGQNISPEAFIDVIAQKHRNFLGIPGVPLLQS